MFSVPSSAESTWRTSTAATTRAATAIAATIAIVVMLADVKVRLCIILLIEYSQEFMR